MQTKLYTRGGDLVPPSLADRAYEAIRELIVTLELPPGAVVEERRLVESLEIGRTPVREALRRLAHEQLVEVFPRRGIFVTDVDVRELARISEVRAVLEPEAARLAAIRATDADRAGLAPLLEQLDDPEGDERALMALDERVHRTVHRAAHNGLLEATLGQYYVLALRIWVIALDRQRSVQSAIEQHGALLESILDRNPDDAAAAMRGHVLDFEQAMRQVLITP